MLVVLINGMFIISVLVVLVSICRKWWWESLMCFFMFVFFLLYLCVGLFCVCGFGSCSGRGWVRC